ncbi:MAG TPA: AAA family ATPase [Nitrososphaeraceae archaeon]|nr:AAA family ATPase [Nitrososphaeraceae archaeon]
MFKNLFKKFDGVLGSSEEKITPEEKFFSNVVGYADIKKLLLKSIVSKEPVSILLTGPPSSSKTIFLLEMLEGLDDTYFIDAVGASGAGMTDHLFKNNTKYLLIDEIDKMKKNDQATLLNVMETGLISETKVKKTRRKKMKLWVFATSNVAERLSAPLRSRFMELHLDEYTYEEFVEIVRTLLKKRYKLDVIISQKIAYAVWNNLESRDIRDAINIAKLTRSSDDVNWLIDVQIRYGKNRS